MALMIHAAFDDKDLDPSTIVVQDTAVAVPAERIAVYIGDDVAPQRQNEIINGWKWLWAGVRDRGLLEDGNAFAGALLYTAASIDSLTEYNRRTASDTGFFNADDVMIGIGDSITGSFGAVDQLKVAFDKLASVARAALAEAE